MNDLKIVLRDTGAVLIAVGIISLIVGIVPILFNEVGSLQWIIITCIVFLVIGGIFRVIGRTDDETRVRHAMVTAALSWLIISLISAILRRYL